MTLWEFIASAGGGSLIGRGISWIFKIVKVRKETSPSDGLRNVVDVYNEMHRILSVTDIDRINIYMLEDSGGKIVVGAPQYITCIYDDFGKGLLTDRYDFQKFLIDKSFAVAFNSACEDGLFVVNQDSKAPFEGSSKLRDIMLDRRMCHIQFHMLAQTETKSFFIELSSREKLYTDMN